MMVISRWMTAWGPRRETNIAILLLTIGVIIYVVNPGSYYWKTVDNDDVQIAAKRETLQSVQTFEIGNKTNSKNTVEPKKRGILEKEKNATAMKNNANVKKAANVKNDTNVKNNKYVKNDANVKNDTNVKNDANGKNDANLKNDTHVKQGGPNDKTAEEKSSSNLNFSVDEEIKLLNKINAPKTVLAATDSHGLSLQRVFEEYLPKWNFLVWPYPGFTLEQVVQEISGSLQFIDPLKQTFIILHAGTNDFFFPARGPKRVSPLSERHSDDYIIKSAHYGLRNLTRLFPKAEVIYSANLPRADIPEYHSRKEVVNRGIKAKMESIPKTHFVDHTHLFHNESGKANTKLLVRDLLHMNDKGRNVLVKNLIRTMAKVAKDM